MNITNLSTVSAPVETMPLESPTPVSAPDKVDTTEKAKNQKAENNRQAAKAKEEQTGKFSAQDAKQLAAEMNEIMDDLQTNLGFSIREDLGNQVVVEIKNRETNELIKQIPSEELLAIKEKMEELTGLLLDHSA